MERLILVQNGMSISIAGRVANTKKKPLNVPNGVKWDTMRQTLLVTNEMRSVIGFGEQIPCEFGAKMVTGLKDGTGAFIGCLAQNLST
jgi:hypothetical protein